MSTRGPPPVSQALPGAPSRDVRGQAIREPRRSVVREAMLVGLGEARELRDIATLAGISDKSVSERLRVMVRLGMVLRLSETAFVRADAYVGPLPPPAPTRRPRPRRQLRDAVLAALDTPQTVSDLARRLDAVPSRITSVITSMRAAGLVQRSPVRGFERVDPDGFRYDSDPRQLPLLVRPRAVGRRVAPIRDRILEFLTEPRSASAIAAHIDRPTATATGHLTAMRRAGLAIRLGYASYARAGYDGPLVTFPRCAPTTTRTPKLPRPWATASSADTSQAAMPFPASTDGVLRRVTAKLRRDDLARSAAVTPGLPGLL